MHFIARSIVAKIILAFSLVVITLIVSYTVMAQRLNTIDDAMSNVADISSYSTVVIRINKDVIEMQRDISVYSLSGSDAVFDKITDNFQDIQLRLEALHQENVSAQEYDYIDKMTDLLDRIGSNLNMLSVLYKSRGEMIDGELESIYQAAIQELSTLEKDSDIPDTKLAILEENNDWHTLHRSAWQFLTKKDYSKRRAVNAILNRLVGKNIDGIKSNIKLHQLAREYQTSFAKSIQVNRNYLNLMNVVMAGDANEFGTLANALRELSLERLKSIKKVGAESIATTEVILNLLSLEIVIYLLMLVWFFHVHLTKAIVQLTHSFRRFLSNDLTATISQTDRRDEIGVLAEAASRFRDMSIDLEKQKKAAEHTSKVKSEFLANMSHEIRTPMNGILGMASQLYETKLSSNQKEMLDIVKSSGESLLVIINDILDLSKIQADKVELEKSPVNLNSMMKSLELLFKGQAVSKGIKLQLNIIPEGKDIVFLGDETRLKQVLMNLIGNAIKFTSDGAVCINVKATKQSDKTLCLDFSVSDTGIGIDSQNLDKLFEAFTQADTSVTRKFGGTGLGLTISSKLLYLMGSELNVESKLGKGANFNFAIKAEIAEIETPIDEEKMLTLDDDNHNFSHLNILVAEDNKTNQIVIKGLLNKLNVGSIALVEDGEQAIEQCNAHKFDLIFMDIQMPVKDGLQATLEIKKMEKYHSVPIIALTANVFEEDKKHCMEVGMCDFIAKPVNVTQLEEALIRWR